MKYTMRTSVFSLLVCLCGLGSAVAQSGGTTDADLNAEISALVQQHQRGKAMDGVYGFARDWLILCDEAKTYEHANTSCGKSREFVAKCLADKDAWEKRRNAAASKAAAIDATDHSIELRRLKLPTCPELLSNSKLTPMAKLMSLDEEADMATDPWVARCGHMQRDVLQKIDAKAKDAALKSLATFEKNCAHRHPSHKVVADLMRQQIAELSSGTASADAGEGTASEGGADASAKAKKKKPAAKTESAAASAPPPLDLPSRGGSSGASMFEESVARVDQQAIEEAAAAKAAAAAAKARKSSGGGGEASYAMSCDNALMSLSNAIQDGVDFESDRGAHGVWAGREYLRFYDAYPPCRDDPGGRARLEDSLNGYVISCQSMGGDCSGVYHGQDLGAYNAAFDRIVASGTPQVAATEPDPPYVAAAEPDTTSGPDTRSGGSGRPIAECISDETAAEGKLSTLPHDDAKTPTRGLIAFYAEAIAIYKTCLPDHQAQQHIAALKKKRADALSTCRKIDPVNNCEVSPF